MTWSITKYYQANLKKVKYSLILTKNHSVFIQSEFYAKFQFLNIFKGLKWGILTLAELVLSGKDQI